MGGGVQKWLPAAKKQAVGVKHGQQRVVAHPHCCRIVVVVVGGRDGDVVVVVLVVVGDAVTWRVVVVVVVGVQVVTW